MGYCTRIDIENVIAQALTSATTPTADGFNTVAPLMNIGNTLDKNTVPYSQVDAYIQIADSRIDSMLSQLYVTPFKEIITLDIELFAHIDNHNNFLVFDNVAPLKIGDQIIISDKENKERHIIKEIVSNTVFETDEEIQIHFEAGSRVVRVSYPEPIRYTSARMSAANLYDKYFSSENAPNVSTFGKFLRDIARQDINNILNGRTILHGQDRIGRRFVNPNLIEQYDLPKGSEGSKDIDSLSG